MRWRLPKFLRWRLLAFKTPEKISLVSLILSALSFSLAAASLYITALRRTDDLRLIIHQSPGAVYTSKGLEIFGEHHLFFVNAGHRPAAILQLNFYLLQESGDSCARAERGAPIGTNFEPFVVKENEVAARKLETKYESSTRDLVIPLSKKNSTNKTIEVQLCYRFVIGAPSNSFAVKDIQAFYFPMERNDDSLGYVDFHPVGKVIPPIQLYYHRGTIFSD